MRRSTRYVALLLVSAGCAFGAGWFLRDRRASQDEASRDYLDVLMNAFAGANRDRSVLVMIEKGRTEQLPSFLEQRLAENLISARKLLREAPEPIRSPLNQYPWAAALLPNVANEFRSSAEYLARHGKYPQAVQDGEWLVKQVRAFEANSD